MKLCDLALLYSHDMGGGVNRYLKDKMEYLRRREDVEHVLILPGSDNGLERDGRSVTHVVKSMHLLGSKSYRLLTNTDALREIFEQERPDMVEIGTASWPAWRVTEMAKEMGVAVTGFYHSDFPRSYGALLGKYLNSATIERLATSVLEDYLARFYNDMDVCVTATRHFGGLLRDMGVRSVARLSLGTDVGVFYPRDSRAAVLREFNLPPETFLLLFVGRLASMKNLPRLITMLDLFQPEEGPVRLLLVGDGEQREMVEEAAARRADLIWLPYVSDAGRLAELYSAADLFINPGSFETFGLVSLEAQACGARVLGVRGGGMEETLEGEEPLIMAESEHEESLAAAVRAIRALREGPDAAIRRRRRIVNRFSMETTFGRLFELYAAVLRGDPLDAFLID